MKKNLGDKGREISEKGRQTILQQYLDTKPTDFIRFRWFLRRLTQIGHPGAVRYCLTHLDLLTPALSDVCHYLLAASQNLNGDIPGVGKELKKVYPNQKRHRLLL